MHRWCRIINSDDAPAVTSKRDAFGNCYGNLTAIILSLRWQLLVMIKLMFIALNATDCFQFEDMYDFTNILVIALLWRVTSLSDNFIVVGDIIVRQPPD